MAVAMNFDCDTPDPICCTCCTIGQKQKRDSKRKGCKDESGQEPLKNRYQAGVLVGNWLDRRATYDAPPDEWVTVYGTTYVCKKNEDLKDDRRVQKDNKIKVEQGLGREVLINQPNEVFLENFTSTNDLLYRVLPKGLCGPRMRRYSSRKDQWLPEIDLSKNYGNLTDLGFSEGMECFEILASQQSPRESIQQRDFKKPGLKALAAVKRFPKPKTDLNKCDLCLLDIDPELPFKPHLVRAR